MDPLKGESAAPALSNVDAIFISKIEEVNWLLNIRALGVHECDPLFNAFIMASRVRGRRPEYHLQVYVEDEATASQVKEAVAKQGIKNCTVELISEFRESLSASVETLKVTNNTSRRMKVAIDKNSCTQKYYELLYQAFGCTPESV